MQWLMDVKLEMMKEFSKRKYASLQFLSTRDLLLTPHMEGKELKVLTLGQLPEVIH